MANETSTFMSGASSSLKETVDDAIYSISPADTVFMNLIGTEKADGIKYEWLEDSDTSPSSTQKAEEWDGTIAASDQPSRKYNYTQIFGKSFGVTDTMETAAKYGRKSEIERLIQKNLRLVAKDIEYTLLNSTSTPTAHASGTGGVMKGLKGWVSTNTYDFGGSYAATNKLTEDLFNAALQACWDAGGEPQTVLAPSYVARTISGFNGNDRLTLTMDANKTTVVNAVDYYRSSFGLVQVHLTRWLAPYDNSGTKYDFMAVIDKEKWATAWLKKTKMERQSKKGLVTPVIISAECTLAARNEAANYLMSKITRA